MFFVSEVVEIHANGVVLYVAISTGPRLDFFDFALEICSFSKVPFSLLFTSFFSVLKVPGFMVLRIALKTPSSFFTFAATELCILLLSLALDAFHPTQITVRKLLVVYESILLVVSPTVKPQIRRLSLSGWWDSNPLPRVSRTRMHPYAPQPVIHLWDPLYTPGPETSRPGHLFGAPGPWVQEDVAAPFPLSRANFLYWCRFCVHRLEITSGVRERCVRGNWVNVRSTSGP